MKPSITITAVLILVVLLPSHVFGQIERRNLFEYLRGGTYDRKNDFASKSLRALDGARNFLWTAWQKKQRAFFRFYDYNREGDRVNTKFYIEPDPSGSWRVFAESSQDRCDRGSHTMKRSCGGKKVETIYTRVYWEKLIILDPDKPIKTDIDVLVLSNPRGERFEFRYGPIF